MVQALLFKGKDVFGLKKPAKRVDQAGQLCDKLRPLEPSGRAVLTVSMHKKVSKFCALSALSLRSWILGLTLALFACVPVFAKDNPKSDDFETILEKARELARGFRHKEIRPEHVVYVVIQRALESDADDNNARTVLQTKLQIPAGDLQTVAQNLEARFKEIPAEIGDAPITRFEFSKGLKALFNRIDKIAEHNNGSKSGVPHLVAAIAEKPKKKDADSVAFKKALEPANLTTENVTKEVEVKYPGKGGKKGKGKFDPKRFTKDLSKIAAQFDPISGRELEIRYLVQEYVAGDRIPVVRGRPGSGKTVLIKELARLIAIKHDSVKPLWGKKIIEVDIGGLLAGNKYRGDEEAKIQGLIKESKADPDIIFYFDEIHTLVKKEDGGGGEGGSSRAANLLKSAISEGDFRAFGSTTTDESVDLEKDPAMARRVSFLDFEEKSKAEIIEMVKSHRFRLEGKYGIKIPEDTFRRAVELTMRYVADEGQPGATVKYLESAAARLLPELDPDAKPLAQLELENEVRKQNGKVLEWENKKNTVAGLKVYEEEVAKLTELETKLEKLKELWATKFPTVLRIIAIDLELDAIGSGTGRPALEAEREKLVAELRPIQKQYGILYPEVLPDLLAQVITRKTGIPISMGQVDPDVRDKANRVRPFFRDRLIGQPQVHDLVPQMIRNRLAGNVDPKRPQVFLAGGPPGTGKSFTGKLIAEFLFDDPDAAKVFPLGDYQSKEDVSRLIGSAPGLVGSGKPGLLTEYVRRNPYCVIILDEIEKAHPRIMDILLQILEEGRSIDNQGRVVDFSNVQLILTTNLGAQNLNDPKLPLAEKRKILLDALRGKDQQLQLGEMAFKLRDELLSRIGEDNIVPFDVLTAEDKKRIMKNQLDEWRAERESLRGVDLVISDEAYKEFDRLMSARPIEMDSIFGARFLRTTLFPGVLDSAMTELAFDDATHKAFAETGRARIDFDSTTGEFFAIVPKTADLNCTEAVATLGRRIKMNEPLPSSKSPGPSNTAKSPSIKEIGEQLKNIPVWKPGDG